MGHSTSEFTIFAKNPKFILENGRRCIILNVGGADHNEPKTMLDWHTGFRSAFQIEMYKPPGDYISINDFYKVYGYACVYISDTNHVAEINPEEVTLTFVSYYFPREMVNALRKQRGIRIAKREEGIYDLSGDYFPMQLIVTNNLTKEKNFWLKNLRTNISGVKEISELLSKYERHKSEGLYESVMNIITRANKAEFKEAKVMCEALMELMSEELEEAKRNGMEQGERIGEARGEARGEERGVEKGVKALIASCHEFYASREKALELIRKNFSLGENEMETLMEKYW